LPKQEGEVELCPTHLLSDAPSEEDAFRHTNVAHAIAQMVLTERGGRAIALTGKWGSGKSTVVTLLAKFLRTCGHEVKVITFDAWAHEGDPLRRSFLEVAIAELADWIGDKDDWEKRVKILSRRLVITTTKSMPKLEVIGLLGAFALVLSPVAFQLFGVVTKNVTGGITTGFWFIFALGASPLFVALYILLKWWRSYLHGEIQSLPAIIYSSSENEVTTASDRTPEPTSVEFEKTYCDLLKETIGKRNRRLVIVIDNLDRVGAEDARKIWSTLRTFFDKVLREEPWFEKTWIMLPFDEQALSGTNGAGQVDDPFIEKTFQAFFRVPPVLLTNWGAFLKEQLHTALPLHSAEDFQEVFRIYDYLKVNDGEPPTPRELKLFVNRVGALHRQWQDEIDLTTQAAFVLKLQLSKDDFVPQLRRSREAEFLPEAVTRRLGSSWERDMAAIYYGVPLSMALEALLSGQVVTALGGEDDSALAKLESAPGFSEVVATSLERLLGGDINEDQNLLISCVLAFDRLPIIKQYIQSRDLLFDKMGEVDSWSQITESIGRAIAALQRQAPGRSIAPFLRAVENSYKEGFPNVREGVEIWTNAVAQILSVCKLSPMDELDCLCLAVSPPIYLQMAASFSEKIDDLSRLRFFRFPAGIDKVITSLVDMVNEAKWETYCPQAVEALIVAWPEADWNSLAQALAAALGGDTVGIQERETFAVALSQIIEAIPNIDISALQQGLVTVSGIENLATIFEGPSIKVKATMAVLVIVSDIDLSKAQPQMMQMPGYPYRAQQQIPLTEEQERGNLSKDFLIKVLSEKSDNDFESEFMRLATTLFHATQWREAAQQDSDRASLVPDIFDRAVETASLQFFGIGELLENSRFWIEQVSDVELFRAISLLGGEDAAREWLSGQPFETDFIPLYRKYLEGSAASAVRSHLYREIEGIEEGEWNDLITAGGPKFDFILSLGERAAGAALALTLRKILSKNLDDDSFSSLQAAIPDILKIFKKDDLESFLAGAAEEFENRSGPFEGTIELWGSTLALALKKSGVPKASDRMLEIIRRAQEDELNWLASLLQSTQTGAPEMAKLISKLKTEVRQQIVAPPDIETPKRLSTFINQMGWKFRI